ncbi:MAG: hypothetical protein J2P43_01190 [Candidatus Dormibacteraeota bacterium]|nr:hypothetical protein [Candidatus Dormibacteraeota bacterium]
MSEWLNDPDARSWGRSVLDELLPTLRDSACTVSIVPDSAGLGDVKFAVELGLSIMLDKPIILAVVPGRELPDRLVRVADEIVEFDGDDPETMRRLHDAIGRVIGEDQ